MTDLDAKLTLDSFFDDLQETVAETVEEREEPWRKEIREAVDAAEREGFEVKQLLAYQDGSEPEGWQGIVDAFKADVQGLRDIDNQLDALGSPWPEAVAGILKDPETLDEAMAFKDHNRDVALLLWRRASDFNPHNEAVSTNLELLSGE